MENKAYDWKYVSIGGVVRVKIESGEHIAHLGELDQKKWTVLSCPVKNLNMDKKTLALLDADGDGKIRVAEVVEAAQWLTSVIKDKDLILKGEDTLALDQIDTECEAGLKLYNSAKQILSNLGLEKDSISVADTSDSVAIFAKTQFNGDGVVTLTSTEDEDLKKLIEACMASSGSAVDRSGEAGVDAETVEKFYAALADYAAWMDAAESDKANVFPFGDNTAAACAAVDAVADKVADYFMRCKLINFDEAVSGAVDVSVDKVTAIGGENLATRAEEIATYPLARPTKEQVLPLDAINPAWQAAMGAVKSLVLDAAQETLTEAQWLEVVAKFDAYKAWVAAEKGNEVAALGLDAVKAFLAADKKQALLDLIASDKALEEEANGIDAVDKLTHFYRDFYHFLNNYVIFSDFYSLDPAVKSVFDEGSLYIDERCCKLCIKVDDMGKHADMAALSNMFLIYCTCTSQTLGRTMDIVAVMTDGNTRDLRPGKNAIFYDLEGNDWDAVVTKVVDNPISVKQAFWGPYRKLAKFVSDKIDKSAADKDASATSGLLAKADTADPTKPAQSFDIAKFAGIFAAIGMAMGALGVALSALFKGIFALKWWQLVLVLVAIMLIISGPACFIAWRKLRKRNLGPVLNANGWAINSQVLVNIIFGGTLTSVAKYPVVKGGDPFAKKTPAWRKWLRGILAALVVAFAALFFTDNLKCIGLPFHKEEPVEVVEEAVEAAEAVESGVEAAPEAAASEVAETPAE